MSKPLIFFQRNPRKFKNTKLANSFDILKIQILKSKKLKNENPKPQKFFKENPEMEEN